MPLLHSYIQIRCLFLPVFLVQAHHYAGHIYRLKSCRGEPHQLAHWRLPCELTWMIKAFPCALSDSRSVPQSRFLMSSMKCYGRCKKTKPVTDFPLKKEGGARHSRCVACWQHDGHGADGMAKSRKSRTYLLDDSMETVQLCAFLGYISSQTSSVNLEARVKLSTSISGNLSLSEKLLAYKLEADSLKDLLNNAMPYRFVYVPALSLYSNSFTFYIF